jgi:hypothetical protein
LGLALDACGAALDRRLLETKRRAIVFRGNDRAERRPGLSRKRNVSASDRDLAENAGRKTK